MDDKRLTVFDAFAGCGGLSTGLIEAGLNVKWANENWNAAGDTYLRIHKKTKVFKEDAREILIRLKDKDKDMPQKGDVDLFCGGPPCQGFCGMNRHRTIDDKRNSLVEVFFNMASILKPRFILMENVTGILSLDDGKIVNKLQEGLKTLGYFSKIGILQAGYYGVPQNRWRVFIIATQYLKDLPKFPEPLYQFPSLAVHNAKRFKDCVIKPSFDGQNLFIPYLPQITVGQAIKDLPEIENAGSYAGHYTEDPQCPFQLCMREGSEDITWHETTRMRDVNMKRIVAVPLKKGAGWLDLPDELKPRNLARLGTNSYDNRFGRLHWDGQFNTIMRKVEPYWSRVIHPTQHRMISARECARAQGIPDYYNFSGRLAEVYAQIGNAVPPPLARAIGWEIYRVLGDKTVDEKIEKHRKKMLSFCN